jgi:transcriptional regulator of acetoin/glycerol metabolism
MSRELISIENQALDYLKGLEFPGNVRELENMVERAIVIGNGKEIKLRDFPQAKNIVSSSVESLDDIEKKHIQQILQKYSWNISKAAKALNIDRVTLYNKIKKYQLEK